MKEPHREEWEPIWKKIVEDFRRESFNKEDYIPLFQSLLQTREQMKEEIVKYIEYNEYDHEVSLYPEQKEINSTHLKEYLHSTNDKRL